MERHQSTKLSTSNNRKNKKSVDQGGEYDALHTDLSNGFDCLPHNLIIVELNAYGLDKSSLLDVKFEILITFIQNF